MNDIISEILPVTMKDGTKSAITAFTGSPSGTGPVLICMPAMGVSAKFYQPLSAHIVSQGWILVTSDLRGNGCSSIRAAKGTDFGYHEMITYDWPAVIKTVKNKFPEYPVFLLGHSLGGQLSALYLSANPRCADGLILVAAPSVFYKSWPFPQNLGVLVGTQIAGFTAAALGYFPGKKIGFGGATEAKQVILDWARQARTGRYEPAHSPLDFESLLRELEIHVLAISFKSDFFAPGRAVGHLCSKMSRAQITRVELKAEGLSHFDWVRNSGPVIEEIRKWFATEIPAAKSSR
ncbi:MAG: alpha/beta fold hydrolase [Syntrophales bacterium]